MKFLSLFSVLLAGSLLWAPAKADVTYTLYAPGPGPGGGEGVVLQFFVPDQLTPTSGSRVMEFASPIGIGAFAWAYGIRVIVDLSIAADTTTIIMSGDRDISDSTSSIDYEFNGTVFFPADDATIPGNGTFAVDPINSSITFSETLFVLGIEIYQYTVGGIVNEMTVSGVPVGAPSVPEPSTWALIVLGFAGLGYSSYRASWRNIATA